jgi:hypothetical protein
MTENNMPVCTIRQRSLLLNHYSLEFTRGAKWNFHLPLFTIYYKGTSDTGDEVLVRMPRHDTWQLKIGSDADSLYLITALALIHRERQRFS